MHSTFLHVHFFFKIHPLKKSNHVLLSLIISELIPSQLGVASTGFDPLRLDVLKGNIGEKGEGGAEQGVLRAYCEAVVGAQIKAQISHS